MHGAATTKRPTAGYTGDKMEALGLLIKPASGSCNMRCQ